MIVLAAIIGGGTGFYLQKKKHEQEIQEAYQKASQIIADAKVEAADKHDKVIQSGKQRVDEYRESNEEELASYEADNRTRESRIAQRQRANDSTQQRLDQTHTRLAERRVELDEEKAEIAKLHDKEQELQQQRLSNLQDRANMTWDNAKDEILSNLADDLKKERDVEIRYLNDESEVEAPKIARILAEDSIQRGTQDYPREHTEHSIQFNDNGSKQKLVGKDNINLRYIESLAGVDLIFDPDDNKLMHIATSDPVRREIARNTINNLMVLRQVNAQTIEQQINMATNDIMTDIRKVGEDTVTSLHIGFVHPDLMKIIGRLKYRTSYGQNVLNHSIEVAQIAGLLASELGFDVRIARRAGLLHDVGKAIDHDVDGTHVELGVKIAETFGEDERVINAIASHHGDVEVTTPIANLVAAGDSISGGRPGARSESVEEYINRLRSLEHIASQKDGVKESYAIQAGREIRIMVDPQQVDDRKLKLLTNDVKDQIQDELTYPGKIKVTSIRSFKAVSFVGKERRRKKA
ncbi:ribonuclease Y [Lentilactobacillus sp. Marseille-Q4993]|uniref:ribonuclease Y n=1 Tax=Lentilactobacillus sp. Marseille-Q4993 TaxID=3039492 RepID=UPI0024BC72A2|nr:ribonuclease Y [Lentilactobacillus sp. Marseille-Q4993]